MDRSAFKIYGIVIVGFSIYVKLSKIRFFETFLLPYISMNIILKILFLAFSNTKIQFNTNSFT